MSVLTPEAAALELAASLQSGSAYDESTLEWLVREALSGDDAARATKCLFRDVVEPLCDAFEPALVDRYVALFARVMELAGYGDRDATAERYQRVRRGAADLDGVRRVFVLSRVTIGADVAITSVALAAVKQRFPDARVTLVGSAKAWGLFDADPRIDWLEAPYARGGGLAERLEVSAALARSLDASDALVVDPDSRLTQLGLVPVCREPRYLFFESRGYCPDSREALSRLTGRWCEETLGFGGDGYVSPAAGAFEGSAGRIAMSLGTGGNPAKRIEGDFEARLVAALVQRGCELWIDEGAGGEEAERVRDAAARAKARPGQIRTQLGSFAPFAATIAAARGYIGYDSAGQHVAAAAGTPLVTVFRGFVSERMLQRWTPHGPGQRTVVRVDERIPDEVLAEVLTAVEGWG